MAAQWRMLPLVQTQEDLIQEQLEIMAVPGQLWVQPSCWASNPALYNMPGLLFTFTDSSETTRPKILPNGLEGIAKIFVVDAGSMLHPRGIRGSCLRAKLFFRRLFTDMMAAESPIQNVPSKDLNIMIHRLGLTREPSEQYQHGHYHCLLKAFIDARLLWLESFPDKQVRETTLLHHLFSHGMLAGHQTAPALLEFLNHLDAIILMGDNNQCSWSANRQAERVTRAYYGTHTTDPQS